MSYNISNISIKTLIINSVLNIIDTKGCFSV
jgi:hypothetical protein